MPQPYPGQHWKHGWIPVTEAALRSKLKKGGPPRGKSPKITEAAAEAGAILRRMREQDAARRRSVTHVVDTRPSSRGESSRPAPTRTSSGGSRRPAAGRSTTAAGGEGTSRQADDAIRQAAGRQSTPQRQAERPAPRPAAERPAPQQRQAERPPARQPEAASRPAPTSTSRGGTSDGSGAPVDGRPSNKPIARNAWGVGSAHTNEIAYHDDGAIGSAIKNMGDDARMDVDGEPLANVLGRLATDAVAGRKTTQEMVDAVKRIRDRLPAGSAARRELDSAIRDMDAPTTPAPKVPDGVPAPLRELAQALHSVPTVRNDPGTELEPLLDILNRFAQGRTGGRRMLGEVRALANKRHESLEGKAEIDRLIQKALSDLEALARQDRTALYPPRR